MLVPVRACRNRGWLCVSDFPRSSNSKQDGTLIDYAAYARKANKVVQGETSRRAASLSLRPISESVIYAIFPRRPRSAVTRPGSANSF